MGVVTNAHIKFNGIFPRELSPTVQETSLMIGAVALATAVTTGIVIVRSFDRYSRNLFSDHAQTENELEPALESPGSMPGVMDVSISDSKTL